LELVARGGQLFAKRTIVLDDPVVDQSDRADAVRVGILLGWAAVRRPARVADSHVASERNVPQRCLQVSELSDGANDADLAVVDDGYARRVVPPVLEAT
jgi:hypothetical protein